MKANIHLGQRSNSRSKNYEVKYTYRLKKKYAVNETLFMRNSETEVHCEAIHVNGIKQNSGQCSRKQLNWFVSRPEFSWPGTGRDASHVSRTSGSPRNALIVATLS
jgi:hypothetical protein